MNNLLQRAITGIALTVFIIAAVIFSKYSFIGLFFIINLIGLIEFYRLLNSQSSVLRKILGVILSSSIFITSVLLIINFSSPGILLINIPLAFIIYITELYLRSETPFLNIAVTFLGILYITLPCLFVIAIAFLPFEQKTYHSYFMLGYFFIVWANDTGAYFLGKTFGKKLLFQRISPKKTWEGSVGGACCAIIVASLISLLYHKINNIDWIIIASITIVIGTYGDLIKSMLKRSVHVKDSGTILPGHGGVLDRFDSLLSSAPFVFCYLIFFT